MIRVPQMTEIRCCFFQNERSIHFTRVIPEFKGIHLVLNIVHILRSRSGFAGMSVFTLVSDLLVDWQLFAGGWVVHGHQNHHLFHYLCDIDQWQTPPALGHLKPEA